MATRITVVGWILVILIGSSYVTAMDMDTSSTNRDRIEGSSWNIYPNTIDQTNRPSKTQTPLPVPLATSGFLAGITSTVQLPDLVPMYPSISVENSSDCPPAGGESLGLHISIVNLGDGDAGAFSIQINNSPATYRIEGLSAHSTAYRWLVGEGQMGDNTIVADVLNEVTETNEANNTLVTILPYPTQRPTCTWTLTPTITLTETSTNTPNPTPTPTFGCVPEYRYLVRSLPDTCTAGVPFDVEFTEIGGDALISIYETVPEGWKILENRWGAGYTVLPPLEAPTGNYTFSGYTISDHWCSGLVHKHDIEGDSTIYLINETPSDITYWELYQ